MQALLNDNQSTAALSTLFFSQKSETQDHLGYCDKKNPPSQTDTVHTDMLQRVHLLLKSASKH